MILSKEPMRISNVEGEEHISLPGEGLIGMMWLNLGVSDHHKASLDPIIFKASALWADAFYKSICPSVCPCVCPFTFEVPFNGLFAPTSRSRMSNISRDLESLGKSNGKKWSNIWTFFFGNGLKSPRNFFFFFADFAGYNCLIPFLILSGL